MKAIKLFIAAVLTLGLLSCGLSQTMVQNQGDVSNEELSNMLWMVEEEKLASDVYQTLYDTWGIKIFRNIGAESEVQHVLAVSNLMAAYGIEDPSLEARGQFTNPDLQALYDQLVAQGQVSLEQALYVGATIEEVDIVDLQKAISETERPDILQVYESLLKGSRNHLRSFMKQIDQRGFSYEPQYVDQASFDAIVTSPMEQGNH